MVIMEPPQPAKTMAELRMVKHLLEEDMAVEEVEAMGLPLLPADMDLLLLLLVDMDLLLLLLAGTEVVDLEVDMETNQVEDMTEVIILIINNVYLHYGLVWYRNLLNAGLVWYPYGRFVSGCQMGRNFNGGLKTGLKIDVYVIQIPTLSMYRWDFDKTV